MFMRLQTVIAGALFWISGTILIRLAGQWIFRLSPLVLYAASFVVMAVVVPCLFAALRIPSGSWPQAATLLMLPTLLLDPLSCAFFSSFFPNVHAAAAGVFGGWMLVCCGGAAAGAWIPALKAR